MGSLLSSPEKGRTSNTKKGVESTEPTLVQPSLEVCDDAQHIGLENYGNSCYCNSVIQTLYHCSSLRERLLVLWSSSFASGRTPNDSVLFRLSELFSFIHLNKKKKGFIGPSDFVKKVKKSNIVFDNHLQHDAHEFTIYILNTIIEEEKTLLNLPQSASSPIQEIFEGRTRAMTFCLDCETRTEMIQPFIDLNLQIEPNTSLMHCISSCWAPEFFSADNKFHCDACCSQVCAKRCLVLDRTPKSALIVHLKRFSFVEQEQLSRKLAFHVPLPDEIALRQHDDSVALFRLKGFIVHHGAGANLGHYIGCFRSKGQWRKYDDDAVSELQERDIQQYFGEPRNDDQIVPMATTAYILLYERA